MIFLVDYENVHYTGLEGTEFLEKDDKVIFFFSETCKKIVSYRMDDIEASCCDFEICKLEAPRKNAMDFYIASKVGEILAIDPKSKVAIISADNGYQSVLDYWKSRLSDSNQLIFAKTITKAIKAICGEGARKKIVNEKTKVLDLQTEYEKYTERKRIVTGITDLFSGTDCENCISQIVDMVIASDKPKVLYLNSLKSFGRKTGMEVYRKIKDHAVNV